MRSFEHMTVAGLRQLARENKVRLPYGVNKAQIVQLLSSRLADGQAMPEEKRPLPDGVAPHRPSLPAGGADEDIGLYKPKPLGFYDEEYGTSNPVVPRMMKAGLLEGGQGVLEVQPGGYGFLRAGNCSPGAEDIYVSIAQIRRFGLRSGDLVVGKTRERRIGDRYRALMYIESVNGDPPDVARQRRPFETLTPVHPDRRLTLETADGDLSMRMLDFIAPIGLGQRALIVAPPKTGKTTLIKKMAQAIRQNHPQMELIVLLVDERPEEVTEMKRAVDAQVIHSTFDAPQENHVRVADMVYERAQRLVEQGKDVVVLMDSLTRLARACNALSPGGRAMSGGLAAGVLQKPKRFFGAARNIEEGGSLTIIATVLVETGSRMDDIIFEEFKGTGNAEIRLDRSLSESRIFPAIDLARSGTRREELLLSEEECRGIRAVRRVLAAGHPREATQQLISLLEKTKNNKDFFRKLQEWLAICEKEGYTIRSLRSSV